MTDDDLKQVMRDQEEKEAAKKALFKWRILYGTLTTVGTFMCYLVSVAMLSFPPTPEGMSRVERDNHWAAESAAFTLNPLDHWGVALFFGCLWLIVITLFYYYEYE